MRKVSTAAACLACLMLLGSCGIAHLLAEGPADPDPPAFTSSHHQLDLLVIAKPETITLGPFHPTVWVFEMCRRSVAQGDNCPGDSRTVSPYGGIWLQLDPGDHLRMRLVNRLPPVPADAKYAHGSDTMMNDMLAANPINIHTHGLIVEPRKADATDPTYGDYIFVLGYPEGKMPTMVMPDLTATDKPIQYDIYIPPGHPSGLYWFHPHVHGLSINQLSEGLSGIITVGSVTDYLTSPAGVSSIPTRYFVLKDVQVLNTGKVLDEENARFCSPFPLGGVSRKGFCQGFDTLGIPDDGYDARPGNYEGGAWYFTVNGRVFPEIPMPAAPGELWRFLNAGASRSYDLVLQDDKTGADIPFQVVSRDGVALAAPSGATGELSGVSGAGKVNPVQCPAQSPAPAPFPTSSSRPVCATHLVLFPGARAEIWVLPQNRPATLRTLMLYTGPRGDRWPQADLAQIVVSQPTSTAGGTLLSVKPVEESLLSSHGLLGAPVRASFAGVSAALPLEQAEQLVNGQPGGRSASSGPLRVKLNARQLTTPQLATIETRLMEISKPEPSEASPTCSALPAGHRRRIFFGVPASNPGGYGLGYEEVDGSDNPVPGTFHDIAAFDPAKINICLPLGFGNTPATETWELVNVSGEAHNFHIHQTKFYVLPQNAPQGDAGALMDSVVLPNGGAKCDGSVANWRSGGCPVETVMVRIPFSQVGDFVYHCHIGEHMDAGMMAHIRVIAAR